MRRVLGSYLRVGEQFLCGLVIGWVLAAAAAYLAARALGRLSFAIVVSTTIVAWLVAFALSFRELRSFRANSLARLSWKNEHTGLAVVLVLFSPIICKLFSAQMLARDASGIYSGGSSLYDLSFHAAVASSFAFGGNFPPIYPVLPPEPLLYPPLPDFHAAMLMTAGWDIRSAFLWTAAPLALAFVGPFYFFALRLAQSVRAAVIATLLFFCNGGLGFVYFFKDWRAGGNGFFKALWTPADNYCNSATRGLHWVNVIADTLAPQRTSLYALATTMIILILFAVVWDESKAVETNGLKRRETRALLVAGSLAGLLSYLQPHTLIAVGIIAIVLFALKPRRVWIVFLVPAVLVSMPFIIGTIGHAASGGFMRFHPGWFARDDANQLVYWLRNVGLPLLLILPAYFAAPVQCRRFYLGFVIVMLVAVLFVLSPNDYDNLKLMFIWYALTCVLIAMWLARLTRRKWLTPVVVVIVVLSIASGLLAVRRGMIEHSLMFNDEQVRAADYLRDHTSPRSLFLTAPTFHQPVLSLAGRPVLRGVTDWLWSHGYNFQEREADVRRIYAGAPDAAELLRYYEIDYLYLGEAERAELKANSAFFNSRFPIFYRSPSITIYDMRGDAESSGALTKPALRELAARIDRDPYALLIEFSRTSFFVYRLYKGSFARLPQRDEFLTAMKVLSRGVFVGAAGWEQQLSANQTLLLSDWMQRDEFKKGYHPKSNAEFVDTLGRNTIQQLSSGARDELVNRLNSGADTRASVLLRFIEDAEFQSREYNSAYVLVHFFGYLGRNPGDLPDRDSSGFNYWLSVLDRTGDYRSLSRAFLESTEYKSRPVN